MKRPFRVRFLPPPPPPPPPPPHTHRFSTGEVPSFESRVERRPPKPARPRAHPTAPEPPEPGGRVPVERRRNGIPPPLRDPVPGRHRRLGAGARERQPAHLPGLEPEGEPATEIPGGGSQSPGHFGGRGGPARPGSVRDVHRRRRTSPDPPRLPGNRSHHSPEPAGRPNPRIPGKGGPATSVVEADPLGRKVFAMWITGAERARIHRAYRETDPPVPLNLP